MKANTCKIMFCLSLIILVGLSGCDSSNVVYLPPSPLGKTPSVRSNTLFFEQGNCERANLKQEFIKAFLVGIKNPDGSCIFNEKKLDAALPYLKQALSDYGNATLFNACNSMKKSMQTTITIQNGHILGSLYGESQNRMHRFKYRGKMLPANIPTQAYEPLLAIINTGG